MWKVMLRDTRANLGRLFMSILAVALGVAFLSGTLSLRDVMSATFSGVTSTTVTEDVSITGKQQSIGNMGSLSQPLDASILDQVEAIEGVDFAYESFGGQAMSYDENGVATVLPGAPGLGFSYNPDVDADRIIEGRAVQATDEVMIELSAATRAGIEIGDELTVYVDKPKKYEVVGIFEFGASMAGATVLYFHIDEAREIFGPTPNSIMVQGDGSVDNDDLKTRIADELGEDYTVKTREETQKEIDDMVDMILNVVSTFLLVFVAIAFAISIFIITNTFTISVKQRQKQFALYRAIGASPAQVFGFVAAQAVIIGLLGSLLGVVVGHGLLIGIRNLIESVGMPLGGDLYMEPDTAVLSVVVGILVTLVAAIVPSRNAAVTPPIEAMRESSGSKERPLVVRGIVAGVVVIAGVVLTWLGSDDDGALYGAGAALLFLGIVLVMPVLVRPAVAVLGWLPRKIAPATGTLASRALVASPRKTAMTAVALAIGIALVAAGATIGASMRASTEDEINEEITVDLIATANTMISSSDHAAGLIREVDGVESVNNSTSVGFAGVVMVNQQPVDNADGVIGAMVSRTSPETFEPLGLTFKEGEASVLDDGKAIVREEQAEENDWGVGDSLLITAGGQPVEVEIGAIMDDQDNVVIIHFGSLIVNEDTFDTIAPQSVRAQAMLINIEDDADLDQVKADVLDAVVDEYVWSIWDQDDLQRIATQQIDMALTFLYAMLALSVIIAVLGIINTLILSVTDRTKEIGLLRAVGLQRAEVRRMITQESIFTTALGAVVGLAVGIGLGLALVRYTRDPDSVVYVIPWLTIVGMLVVSLLVGILAAVIPAIRAANLDVLDAIAEE